MKSQRQRQMDEAEKDLSELHTVQSMVIPEVQFVAGANGIRVAQFGNIELCVYRAKPLLADSIYYWRVSAFDRACIAHGGGCGLNEALRQCKAAWYRALGYTEPAKPKVYVLAPMTREETKHLSRERKEKELATKVDDAPCETKNGLVTT